MKTKYPIYIPSKGRADISSTINIFDRYGIDYIVAVEPQEVEKYKMCENIFVLEENDKGISYVRTSIKKHALSTGYKYHWQIDDNVERFEILLNGHRFMINPIGMFLAIEAFVDYCCNIGSASFIYNTFAYTVTNELGINRQSASCSLFNSEIPIFWNKDIAEDTDYAMQILTHDDGKWCTVNFNRYLIQKTASEVLPGGNTGVEYSGNRREMRNKNLEKKWNCFKEYKNNKNQSRIKPSNIWSKFEQRPVKNIEDLIKYKQNKLF